MTPSESTTLASEAILAEARQLLESGGYRITRDAEGLLGVPSTRGFAAEDRYGVVAVSVYDTWSELNEDWADVQGKLVETISARFSRAEAKAWEGYLVLLTSAVLGPRARETADSIRHDTSRVRKLVATGDELRTLADLRRILLPLMPLDFAEGHISDDGSVLDVLPGLLAERGIDRTAVATVIDAFRGRESLLEALHESLRGTR